MEFAVEAQKLLAVSLEGNVWGAKPHREEPLIMLNIRGLRAEVDGQAILKGINLEVKMGEVHADTWDPAGQTKYSFERPCWARRLRCNRR